MKQLLKKLLKKCFRVINYLPFFNNICIMNNGNVLSIKDAVLLKCKIKCKGRNNKIVCHDGVFLNNCTIYINGNDNIVEIGTNTSVKNTEFYIEDNGNEIVLGCKTRLSGKTHLACIEGTRIHIGDDCLFSSEVVFRTGDSHSLLDMEGNRINPSEDITIGNHVWIGNKVIINKGVSVLENSVVGIGAIVTKSFNESNVAIAGVPAKIIKREINWCTERIDILE